MDEGFLIAFLEKKIKLVQSESCEAHYSAGNADGRFQAYGEILDVLKGKSEGVDLSKVRDFVIVGKKIDAIREYRSITGLGLRESKEFVDKMFDDIAKERAGKLRLKESEIKRAELKEDEDEGEDEG